MTLPVTTVHSIHDEPLMQLFVCHLPEQDFIQDLRTSQNNMCWTSKRRNKRKKSVYMMDASAIRRWHSLVLYDDVHVIIQVARKLHLDGTVHSQHCQ